MKSKLIFATFKGNAMLPLKNDSAPKKSGCGGWIATLLILLIVVVGIGNFNAIVSGTSATPTVDDYDACFMAQKFVRDQLKAPSTANFAPCREPDSVVMGNGRVWQVESWVDAQNSFGAQIRTYFTAQLVYDPDTGKWKFMSLNMFD